MTGRRDASHVNSAPKWRTEDDGTRTKVTYFYHRPTGTPLGNSRDGMTMEKAREVVRRWNAEARQSGPMVGSVNDLFARYRASEHFKALAEKTRYDYGNELTRIEDALGERPVSSLTKQDVLRLRNARQHKPWAANATVRVFSAAFTWGLAEVDYVHVNPALGVSLLPTKPRTAVWTEAQFEAFMQAADPHVRRVAATLRYTLQRANDALQLHRSMVAYHEGRQWITLQQSKTGTLLALPLHAKLLQVYAENPVKGAFLCPSPRGTLWAYESMAKAWDRAVAMANWRIARGFLKANRLPPPKARRARAQAKALILQHMIVGLQRRDLRRSGMVELALRGVPEAQIASLSGHQIATTTKILDTYIPRRADLAKAALETWEKGEKPIVALSLLPLQRPLAAIIEQGMNATANRTANQKGSANRFSRVSA